MGGMAAVGKLHSKGPTQIDQDRPAMEIKCGSSADSDITYMYMCMIGFNSGVSKDRTLTRPAHGPRTPLAVEPVSLQRSTVLGESQF